MRANTLLFSQDPEVVRVLSRALSDLSIGVEICPDVENVIQRLESQKFDAVIVDSDEGCNAWGLLAGMRKSRLNRRSVGVALARDQESFRTAFDMGANLVIDKPIQGERAARNLRAAQAVILRELRRCTRYKVEISATVENGAGIVPATVIDISEGGVGLRTRKPLVAGESVQIRFTLPETEMPFDARVEIVWSKEDGRAGTRFLTFAPLSKLALQRWLQMRGEDELPAGQSI
ncbi:MAG TPA: PilZ domain-containing protein [Terriglobales bacterium]|nr:PilZ domain-containing protein [Terriglobales bacterium]